jgi:hypothetical protein
MGLLSFFRKSPAEVAGLPSGSLTVDREGEILASTVSSAFPGGVIKDIVREVLGAFREASEAQVPLAELNIHYKSLDISARALRGGALLFLSPKTPYAPAPQQ